jgi:hypothetical protein
MNRNALPEPQQPHQESGVTQLQLVSEGKSADVLGVSVAALRRWRREGRGPAFIRLERCVRYRMSDLEHYLFLHTYNRDGGR